jgi:hypothetical protein
MTLEICTSHYKEDLEWLKKSEYPVTVIHHEGGSDLPDFEDIFTATTIENKGKEASAYLKFIIDRYDSLPDHVAFIHGHETSYHQKAGRPLLELIKTANIEKYNFIQLNNIWRFIIRSSMMKEHEPLIQKFNINFPDFSIMSPHAQFIVSKKRILKNPKNMYIDMYDYLMTMTHITNDVVVSFEYIWQYIFGDISQTPSFDYFIPSLDKLCYFPNCSFPRKIPLIVEVTTKEEFDMYNDLGPYFIQYTECDFDTDGKNIFKCKEHELSSMIQYIFSLNATFIKELNLHSK